MKIVLDYDLTESILIIKTNYWNFKNKSAVWNGELGIIFICLYLDMRETKRVISFIFTRFLESGHTKRVKV